MNKITLLSFLLVILVFSACNKQKYNYPKTKKVDTEDNYFGTKVADPYRWLENDTSAAVKQWIDAQNQVTFNYLESIPYRDKIKNRLEKIWNYKRMSPPNKEGGKYFFSQNNGLQNQDVLYLKENLESEAKLVLDPNTFSPDGSASLMDYSCSRNGRYLAYAISRRGSDWREIYVKNLQDGRKLSDSLKWIKFSNIAWYKEGFFYSRYDKPQEGSKLSQANKNHKVYYHKAGTDQSSDELIFQKKDFPKRNYSPNVSRNEKYLYIYETKSTHGNNIYIKNLQTDDAFVKLTTGFEYDYNVIGHIGDQLLIRTNHQAPKYKLVVIDMNKRDVGNWIDLIPEQENVLQTCELAKGKIIASYLEDAHSRLRVYDIEGQVLYNVDLPSLGTVSSLSADAESDDFFYAFSSFTIPSQVWQHNLVNQKSEIYFKPDIDVDPDQYTTEQVFYKSKDGTKIPMFLVHKKGIKMNGQNPVFLYGYGGFNISLTPRFNQSNMIWLENGGIYALPNIRGGGEYGEKWHKQGMRLNKQNVFDDFISAAEYLVDENYTSPNKIAIHGGSNGGLLIGAVVNQRPTLFEVAIPAVGVMDMLKFQKFTIGWAWVDEYGSSNDSLDFTNLYSYSPLHNIRKKAEYPAILAMTADHDDRVVPAHSFKYIATLQEKYHGSNPTMIRIQTRAGHGAGKATSARILEAADMWSFVFHNLPDVKPKY